MKDARRAKRLLWWQTKPCPKWCDFVKDHKPDTSAPDRTCFSRWEGKVNLTLSEDEGDWSGYDRSEYWPPNLNVSLMQRYRDPEPIVTLGFNETSTEFRLTPGEARALAEQLVKGADLAEGHWGAA